MSARIFAQRSCAATALFGFIIGLGGGIALPLAFAPAVSNAQSAADTSGLKQKIDDANAQIAKLQDEIKQLQSQIATTAKQKQTLQNAINALNLNIKKLQASISLTQTQIRQKDAQLQQLGTTIATTTTAVEREQESAAQSIRELDSMDNDSIILTLLSGGTLSDFFDAAVQVANLQAALQKHIVALSDLKANLQVAKSSTETARTELASYQQDLTSKQQGLVTARGAQSQLLTETKNKESSYQALLTQKKNEEAQFESQLNDYQAQLKAVSSGAVPQTGALLSWPLAGPITITQYFGNTPFATANPQIYNGHGHSGIDLAASPGTPVMAAADGVVMGTGNTDLTVPYGSFGKWIFIKHDNGLGTIYAHLGTIGVSEGQRVSRGQVIGYSDTTGYATGPHLHFGVYVASAVTIQQLPTAARQLVIPVAPLSAYLNPLSYLPPTP